MEKLSKEVEHEEEKEGDEDDQSFEELGLDPRLVRALIKKGVLKPTPIQHVAIPLILEGKDVVARAKTGSGKTFAYLLPLLQKLFTGSSTKKKTGPSAAVLVPTRELSQQVYNEISSLIQSCRVQVKVAQLKSSMSQSDLRTALAGPPEIIVATPACIPKCLSSGVLQPSSISESLEFLVLDEADFLLSYGYEDDIKAFAAHIPRSCQCLLMSATSSDDVEKLKKLILHNPFILTLPEFGNIKDDIIPKNIQQFWISCDARDKLLHTLSLLMLKWEYVQRKVLIFTNTIDMSFRLKLFLEMFGIKSDVLTAELPQNSRLRILEEFNAGLFDYLIATDDSETKEKEVNEESNVDKRKCRKRAKQKIDSEFGVVRGIDFKNVNTVMNFELPPTAAGYVHRIGRTGRAFNTGASISLVSPNEMDIFGEIQSFLRVDEDTDTISPFSLLTKKAAESFRYRAEDIAKKVTKNAIKEYRALDLKNQILTSEILKAHFETNPRDLDLLKHDKIPSKNPPASHLRDVPDYLVDPAIQEASKVIKLARAPMGNIQAGRWRGFKRKSRNDKDPLKTFSAEAPKKSRGGGEGKNDDQNNRRKKKKSM